MEELPDVGTCPYCRKELEWDRVDDTKAWCTTPRCRYDNGVSEETNRRLWGYGAEFDRLTAHPDKVMTHTEDAEGRWIWDGVPIGRPERYPDYCGKLGRS